MNSSSPCSRYHPGRAVGGERDAVLEGAGRMVSQRPVGRRSGEAPQRLHRHAHKERFRWSGKEERVDRKDLFKPWEFNRARGWLFEDIC